MSVSELFTITFNNNRLKIMEKKEYMAPELEIIKLQQQTALLAGSPMDETGDNDPNNPTPGPF